jgi:hypothetical protein
MTTSKKTPDIQSDIMGTILTITFSTGHFLEVDVTKLTPEMQAQAMLHGMKQKLVDAAAIARDTTTGRAVTIETKIDAVREVYDRVVTCGVWNKVRGDGSGKGSKSYLCEALMEITGKTRESITAYMASKTKEDLSALKSTPRIATIIARIEAAKVDGVDVEGLLDELDSI